MPAATRTPSGPRRGPAGERGNVARSDLSLEMCGDCRLAVHGGFPRCGGVHPGHVEPCRGPVPREAAGWRAQSAATRSASARRICMLVDSATRRQRAGGRASPFSARTLDSALIARQPSPDLAFIPAAPRARAGGVRRAEKVHRPCHARRLRRRVRQPSAECSPGERFGLPKRGLPPPKGRVRVEVGPVGENGSSLPQNLASAWSKNRATRFHRSDRIRGVDGGEGRGAQRPTASSRWSTIST